MWLNLLFLAVDLSNDAGRARALMKASLAKQQASIERQLRVVGSTPGGASWRWTVPEASQTSAKCERINESDLAGMIDRVSDAQHVDSSLIREVVREESDSVPCAVSPAGAVGLMQLMPATQTRYDVADPLDPQENLMAGAKLLRELLDHYHGNTALALGAYNAGASLVDRDFSVPKIPETQNYVSNILRRLGILPPALFEVRR
jgi:soluble lytic murein transglycosylase-like protein